MTVYFVWGSFWKWAREKKKKRKNFLAGWLRPREAERKSERKREVETELNWIDIHTLTEAEQKSINSFSCCCYTAAASVSLFFSLLANRMDWDFLGKTRCSRKIMRHFTLSHNVFTCVSVNCLHSFSCSINWSKSLSVALSSMVFRFFYINENKNNKIKNRAMAVAWFSFLFYRLGWIKMCFVRREIFGVSMKFSVVFFVKKIPHERC